MLFFAQIAGIYSAEGAKYESLGRSRAQPQVSIRKGARALKVRDNCGPCRPVLNCTDVGWHYEPNVETLALVTINPPIVPLVANVLAQPIREPREIVRCLVEQVTGTVRWRESVAFMAQAGVQTFYEIGAGKVLTGLVKRIAEGASGVAIGTPDDVAAFKTARG